MSATSTSEHQSCRYSRPCSSSFCISLLLFRPPRISPGPWALCSIQVDLNKESRARDWPQEMHWSWKMMVFQHVYLNHGMWTIRKTHGFHAGRIPGDDLHQGKPAWTRGENGVWRRNWCLPGLVWLPLLNICPVFGAVQSFETEQVLKIINDS